MTRRGRSNSNNSRARNSNGQRRAPVLQGVRKGNDSPPRHISPGAARTEIEVCVVQVSGVFWVVDAVENGVKESATFSGPNAEQRARDYMDWEYPTW